MGPDSHRAKFFRQSGWMVSATLAGGICMFAVHIIYPKLGDKEYGLFTTLLAMLNLLTIPALGLQTMFAQQTASALTPADNARLCGTTRGVLGWAFALWGVFALAVGFFRRDIMSTLAIANPIALWLVVVFFLCLLWQPVWFGLLQGRQNFLWLGWALITNGAGRFVTVVILVFACGALATGAIAGALLGIAASVIMAAVQTRSDWNAAERLPFDWRNWLQQIIPLTFGLGAFQFIFSVDVLLVRSFYLENQTGNYNAAGTIARGLVMFTAPLAQVMFPKIVHSKALGKKSNVLVYTLLSCAALSVLAAAGCTFVGHVLRQSIETPGYAPFFLPAAFLAKLQAHPEAVRALGHLIPWFVWCMLPLALGNMLLNNLIAHKEYRVVPYLVLLVIAYVTAVIQFAELHPSGNDFAHFKRVIQILGLANLAFAGLCGWFTWRAARRNAGAALPTEGAELPGVNLG